MAENLVLAANVGASVNGAYKHFHGGKASLQVQGTIAGVTALQALGPDGVNALSVIEVGSEKLVLVANVGASVNGEYKHFHGGKASLQVQGTIAGTTELQVLGPDGVNALSVAAISAPGVTTYDLAPGDYRFITGAGSAGVYANLAGVAEPGVPVYDLAPGDYRFITGAGSAGVYANLIEVGRG